MPNAGPGELPASLFPGPIAFTPNGACLLIAGRTQNAPDLTELWRINQWGNNATELIDQSDTSPTAAHYVNAARLLTDMAVSDDNNGTAYLTSKGYGITEVLGVTIDGDCS